MTGRAEIVVGRRALIGDAFEPLRALRENLAAGSALPDDPGGPPRAWSAPRAAYAP